MANSLYGKVVLVTGAASGIGAAVVKRLLEEDVKHIIMLDINEAGSELEDKINSKYKETKVTFIKCDVTDKEKLLDAFKRVANDHGYIDVLINSAGILDDSPESYVMEININLMALVTSSLHAWKIMHKEKGGFGGTIINFSSITAIASFPGVPIYGATKSAILKFSTDLGDDVHYSKSGVRVLTICFGMTNTPILNNIKKLFDDGIADAVYDVLSLLKIQSPESAASAVIDVYKEGASGSVWLSTSDKSAIHLTDTYNKAYELFKDYIYI